MGELRLEEVRRFAENWVRFKECSGKNPIFRNLLHPPEDWKSELDWERLLFNKILPHSDCLVISVAGGTNTGKSTIINVLIGKEVSPVLPTAGATKRPVMVVSPSKFEQCLNGEMFPQFKVAPLQDIEDVLDPSQPADRLFVVRDEAVEDKYLLLDTPDVDSIRKEHWDIADRIISASDVVIAVLTEEKYNDFAVVDFFKRANNEGKIIVPLMNKVAVDNPRGIEFAREQVSHFLKEAGVDGEIESFYFPRTKEVLGVQPISFSNESKSLRQFISEIPLEETKQKVLLDSVRKLQDGFAKWVNRVLLRKVRLVERNLKDVESRAKEVVDKFQPAPPKEIETHLASAIRKRLGWVKYTVLIPGNILDRFRKRNKEELYKLGEELRANNEKLTVEMIEDTIKLLNETSDLLPDEIVDEFRSRLGEIIKDKQCVIGTLKERVIKDLNLIPDEIIKELDKIAGEFVNSGSLSGLKFIRALSVLLLMLGTGIVVFSLIPGASMIPEYLTLGGTSLLAYFLENEGFKGLKEKVRTQVARWMELKRKRVLEIFEEELFSKLYRDVHEFVQLSKEFVEEESIAKVLSMSEPYVSEIILVQDSGQDESDE